MKIVIAHLYYDLLNLYGESGNVKALKKYLEEQGAEVQVEQVTLNEELYFDDYDFVYIGTGTENNQKMALEHLINYKKDIKKYIKSGKFLLATGNSLELFGKYISAQNGKKYNGLNIFDYYAVEKPTRIVCESIFTSKFVEDRVIGFQNRCSVLKKVSSSWFNVEQGYGSELNKKYEGVHINNFFGTYLIGPLLVRNPELLKRFGDMLVLNVNSKYSLRNLDLKLEKEAYERNLKRYQEKNSK